MMNYNCLVESWNNKETKKLEAIYLNIAQIMESALFF